MPKPGPLRHVKFVHRGPPTEHVVTDQEACNDKNEDRDRSDFRELYQESVKVTGGNPGLVLQRRLQKIEERTAPIVDGQRDQNAEVCGKYYKNTSPNGPIEPAMLAVVKSPGSAKYTAAQKKIEIEIQLVRRHEVGRADRFGPFRHWPGTKGDAQIGSDGVPECDCDDRPDYRGRKEGLRLREEGLEQGTALAFLRRSTTCLLMRPKLGQIARGNNYAIPMLLLFHEAPGRRTQFAAPANRQNFSVPKQPRSCALPAPPPYHSRTARRQPPRSAAQNFRSAPPATPPPPAR